MNAKIGLEDVRLYGPHGYYDEENIMGNEFSIDVEVESSILGAATQDDLGGTVNYSTIYYLLQAEMKKPTKLLEALAYRMANRIMNQFDSVKNVKLRLRKLHPPLGGKVGAAVVEVELGNPNSMGVGAAPAAASPFGNKSVFDEDDDPFGNGITDLQDGPDINTNTFPDEPTFNFPTSPNAGFSDLGGDDDDFDFSNEDFDDDGDFDFDEEEYYDEDWYLSSQYCL